MSELKPCPFCGGKAECFTVNSASWVYCTDCRCETWGCDTPEEAIATWNKRYYSEDAAAEAMRILDSLKEKLEKMRDNPEDRRAE